MTYPTKKLKEVAIIIMGQSPSSKSYNESRDGLPFYQGKKDYGEVHPTPRIWCSAPVKIVERDDILISVRAPVGTLNIASEKSCIGRGLAGVHGGKDLDQGYLYYFLRSKEEEIATWGTGSTFAAISKKHLEDIEIPVPSVGEQRKIVERIEKQFKKIDEVARLRAENEGRTATLFPAALHEVFSSSSWEEKEVGELCTLTNGRAFKSSEWEEDGKYPIIRIQNLNNTKAGGFNYFSGKVDSKIVIENGSLLFSWSGSRGTSFGPHIWTGEIGLLNQHIFKIEHPNSVDRKYFYYALKELVSVVEENLHGGAGLVHITKSKLQKLKVPLPPLAEQKKIVKKLDSLSAKVGDLKKLQAKQSADLKALKQSILHKAFSGTMHV